MSKIKKLEDKMEAKINDKLTKVEIHNNDCKRWRLWKIKYPKKTKDEMEVENDGSKKTTSTHIRLQTKSMKQVCDKRCALKKNL